MSKRSFRKEMVRKLFHLMELPILLGYTIIRSTFGDKLASLAITAVLIILLEIEYIRLEYKLQIPKVIDVLRRHEKENVAGAIFFIAATIIAFSAYDYQIALIALLMTVFGDLASALIGIKFGKHRIYKQKTLEGFIAGLIINLGVGYLFVPEYPLLFVTMAFIASVVELLTGKLDDNLTVPLSAGFAGQLIVFIYQLKLLEFPGPIMAQILRFFYL
jgi:dolichol kinase